MIQWDFIVIQWDINGIYHTVRSHVQAVVPSGNDCYIANFFKWPQSKVR